MGKPKPQNRYQWQAGDETWEVLVDFQRRQIASIGCREWSFGAWVINEEPLQVQVHMENRTVPKISCCQSDGLGDVVYAWRGQERQIEWDTGAKSGVDLSVHIGSLQFPFTVRQHSTESIEVHHA